MLIDGKMAVAKEAAAINAVSASARKPNVKATKAVGVMAGDVKENK